MKNIKSLKALFLSLLVAVVAVFCGFSLTACNDDGGENNGENGGEVTAPEKPLSLTTSVKTTDDGENTYTINAIVNPSILTPRWGIVWENPDSEWATGKDTADYLNLELSNGDKTATLSTKQPFGETALLTATISSPTGEVSVSKKIVFDMQLTYELSADSTYYIVTGTNRTDSFCLVIPEIYNGKPVKRIADSAFENCLISSVFVPDSVEYLGKSVFKNCTMLVDVVLKNVCRLLDYAFYGCTSLVNISLPEENLWDMSGTGLFCNCSSLCEITIPAGVKWLNTYAFRDCISLISVSFKNSVGWKLSWQLPPSSAYTEDFDVTNPLKNAQTFVACSLKWTAIVRTGI